MNTAIAAGAMAYSIRIATPQRKPPHGPKARRAKPYPPPAVGAIVASSASAKHMQVYIVAISSEATNSPPQPPWARPKFQPA